MKIPLATVLLTIQTTSGFKAPFIPAQSPRASQSPRANTAVTSTSASTTPSAQATEGRSFKFHAPTPLAVSTLDKQDYESTKDLSDKLEGLISSGFIESPSHGRIRPESPVKGSSKISDYFSGKSVLITGGTGLVGEVLLSTLLTKIPDIGEIYCIYNQEKGLENEKIRWMKGDTTQSNLGLKEVELLEMQYKVEIIIHLGDDSETKDPQTEITKTCDSVINVADFATNCKALKHTMMASTHSSVMNIKNSNVIGETFYQDFKGENEYEEIRSGSSLGRISEWPDASAYSNNLAERLLQQKYPQLPVTVARLSPACGSFQFPFPGFYKERKESEVPEFVKAMTLDGAAYSSVSSSDDYIPADICVNSILANIVENTNGGQRVIHISSSNRKIPSFSGLMAKTIPIAPEDIKLQTAFSGDINVVAKKNNIILSTSMITETADTLRKRVLLDYNARRPLKWMSMDDHEYFPCDVEQVDWPELVQSMSEQLPSSPSFKMKSPTHGFK